jgi:hypothetical protein
VIYDDILVEIWKGYEMSKKVYNYPEWLTGVKVSWDTLGAGFREYILRRVGYDVNEDNDMLCEEGNEAIIKRWLYGEDLDPIIWCAKGFDQALSVTHGNAGFNNTCAFLKFVYWLARCVYEEGVDNNWWPEDVDEGYFLGEYSCFRGL